ncbi:helix-turn-helix domain-containing protein [Myxococcus sp. K15C18031901]|uniref:helix-turn-helix domain-containing protein n=1 Tax=Myxococcus dinghuensis TaxID=2906761 RepID=UPI0020A76694|nr:helix-turn-helix domain-containing protein [Myxococcus dinghuensis]
MTTAEPWVSVEDVAAHLGVARDSVYRWIEGRGLPAHKLGRLWKFKLSEVDDWVRAGGAVDDEPEAPRRPKRTTKSQTKTTRKS